MGKLVPVGDHLLKMPHHIAVLQWPIQHGKHKTKAEQRNLLTMLFIHVIPPDFSLRRWPMLSPGKSLWN